MKIALYTKTNQMLIDAAIGAAAWGAAYLIRMKGSYHRRAVGRCSCCCCHL